METLEDPAVLREYYRQMALIRAFELRAAEMHTRARIDLIFSDGARPRCCMRCSRRPG
jgi:TPP-dependent pyruvate/acetoin dehydrogenase alpha subunit